MRSDLIKNILQFIVGVFIGASLVLVFYILIFPTILIKEDNYRFWGSIFIILWIILYSIIPVLHLRIAYYQNKIKKSGKGSISDYLPNYKMLESPKSYLSPFWPILSMLVLIVFPINAFQMLIDIKEGPQVIQANQCEIKRLNFSIRQRIFNDLVDPDEERRIRRLELDAKEYQINEKVVRKLTDEGGFICDEKISFVGLKHSRILFRVNN